MKFLVALPIIFVGIALYQVLTYVKSKFWLKIIKIILALAIIYMVIEYIVYIDFDLKNSFIFKMWK